MGLFRFLIEIFFMFDGCSNIITQELMFVNRFSKFFEIFFMYSYFLLKKSFLYRFLLVLFISNRKAERGEIANLSAFY
jgi:hypothetical protein